MQFMYDVFKEQVERAQEMGLPGDKNSNKTTRSDHPPVIEVCPSWFSLKFTHKKSCRPF